MNGQRSFGTKSNAGKARTGRTVDASIRLDFRLAPDIRQNCPVAEAEMACEWQWMPKREDTGRIPKIQLSLGNGRL